MPAKVHLHVYDVTNVVVTKYINKVFRDAANVGGAFHGAVEVYGVEWSFGHTSGQDASGIFCDPPRGCVKHQYKETLVLGETVLSEADVNDLLKAMEPDWNGTTYDVLSKNCCSFCNEFSIKLGTGPIPSWVNRFAGVGSSARDLGSSALLEANRAMETSGVKSTASRLVTDVKAGLVSGLNRLNKR
eukprot:TRINITY_DN16528_c0_g1_i2.p1 TRINITY_DN16528_c0_g1~~TRINITY_DN16528_c0_g1_i2.p1  ORF type:complete len:187 (+),score=40.84 TRINITY_DN16528_c0_g1_i2:198-758(+)